MPMGIGLGIGVTRGGGVGWWPAGSELAFEFDNGRGFNSIDRTKTTPDSILTYTNPSAKMVYGSDGVLRYAPHNLVRYSQELNDALWLKTATGTGTIPVVTPNDATAPDGTQTADRVDFDRGAGNTVSDQSGIAQNFTTTLSAGLRYTASFYVKAADPSSIGKILAYRTVAAAAYSTVVLTDAWQRVSLSATAAATSLLLEFNSRGTSGADNAFSVYLWGAQVSTGSTLFTYIPTTTAAVYSLPIDHNPTTFAPLGVLIEEQRVNLLRYSEDMTNAVWDDATAGLITANTAVAPNGTTTGDTITAAAVSSQKRQVFTGVASTAYTGSWFMKAGTSVQSRFNMFDFTSSTTLANATITWTAGVPVISGVTGTVTAITVGNGWYRIVGTGTSGASPTPSIGLGVYPDNLNGTGTIVVWGAQLE